MKGNKNSVFDNMKNVKSTKTISEFAYNSKTKSFMEQ